MSEHTGNKENLTDDYSFDILGQLDLNNIDWEKEIKYIGALSGSVTGSFISTQLAWSLGLRIAGNAIDGRRITLARVSVWGAPLIGGATCGKD